MKYLIVILIVYLASCGTDSITNVTEPRSIDSIYVIPDTIPILSESDPSFLISAKAFESDTIVTHVIFNYYSDVFNINVNAESIRIDPGELSSGVDWIVVSYTDYKDSVYLVIQ